MVFYTTMSRVHLADAAIVHGGGVIQTTQGEWEPSPASLARTTTAVGLIEAGVVDHLIFSGNNAHGDPLPVTEAGTMATIATELGIEPEKITIEDDSTSFIGNFANSLPKAKAAGIKRLLSVTGLITGFRADKVGRTINREWGLGLDLAGHIPSGEAEGLVAYPRELVALAMSRRCIASARREGVELEDLDEYYSGLKKDSKLAVVKRSFANYTY